MEGSHGGSEVPVGAAVIGADGQTLGKVHTAYRHFFVFEQAGDDPANYEVPMHAVSAVEGGRVLLTVNLEALNQIPSEHQSAGHRMHEEG